MKKLIVLFLFTITAHAGENPIFSYTHMLPSPFTLPARWLVIGTEIQYGLTDFLTVGTNIYKDLYKIYNVNAKVSVFDFQGFAFALTGGYETYNLKDVFGSYPDVNVTSWLPGAVAAFELAPKFAMFAGGRYSITNLKSNQPGFDSAGIITGATGEVDFSLGYGESKNKKKAFNNVFSTGASYDFTYKIYGVGLSHHWSGLQIGFHYYPNAARFKLQPIISGGAVVEI